MARSKTSSFVTEIPLIVDSQQEKELLSRLQAGRQLYNACLNEAEVRMNLVRNSEAYQEARKISKTQKKKRTEAFTAARQAYRFSEYELHTFATITSNKSKWMAQKLDSNTQQTIATRVFKAVEKVLLGKARKVRYKVPSSRKCWRFVHQVFYSENRLVSSPFEWESHQKIPISKSSL